MERALLINANRKIKKLRPKLPSEQVCQVFKTGDILEIGFLSKQCRNDADGRCIMCEYGCAEGTRDNDVYIAEMKKILSECKKDYKCLLLCTNGSFMDETQISDSLFRSILAEADNFDMPEIEIETHYLSVTKEKLETIRKTLPNKKVTIEMGLETSCQNYQDSIIMKSIKLDEFDKTITLIKKYDFGVELNIMLGIPFLTEKEQLEDVLETIRWAFERDCKPVVFPINIKPFTLLWHMYQTGHYVPISHWMVISMLDSIMEDKLNQITIAWYGNREETFKDTDLRAVFPVSCPSCHHLLMEFYSDFNMEKDAAGRKKLIGVLINKAECKCLEKQISGISSSGGESYTDKYMRYAEVLQRDFGRDE